MDLSRALRVILFLVMVSVWVEAEAADQLPRMQIDGPERDLLSFTLRNIKNPSQPAVHIGGREIKILSSSQKVNPDGSIFFQVELPGDLQPGRVPLEVSVGGEVLKPEPLFEIPDPLVKAGKQPLIRKVLPEGGLPHATMTVYGRNFGDDLTKVYVALGPVSTRLLPISISKPDDGGNQELVFAIPSAKGKAEDVLAFNQILSNSSITNPALLSVTVSGRASNWMHLNVVHPQGLWKVAGLSTALIVILLSPLLAVCCWGIAVGFVVLLGGYLFLALFSDRCWILAILFAGLALALLNLARSNREALHPIVRTLFIEKNTETYSLSKVQAFAWTVVLIGSYVYYAVGRGILVGRAEIPDLNEGLLSLLAISYTGLIASRGISKKKPKNEFAPTPPRWTNLITEGNSISITRLQLIGFTIAGIAVYIFYMSGSDLFFKGMPDIPPTLNGLMAISQGGYLGGKIVGDTAVNYVTPRRARVSEIITIFGVGFLDKTKVLIQGAPQAIDTQFVNSNTLKVQLPAAMGDLGLKQLVFIPPTGASAVVSDAFELIDPQVLNVSVNLPQQVSFSLEGIELSDDELRPSINNRVLKLARKEGSYYTLESDVAIAAGSSLNLKTAEGDDLGSVVL
jgi:hypothetical protein